MQNSDSDRSEDVMVAAATLLASEVFARGRADPEACWMIGSPEFERFEQAVMAQMVASGGPMAVMSPTGAIGGKAVAQHAARWMLEAVASGSQPTTIAKRLVRLLTMRALTGRCLMVAWGPAISGERRTLGDVQVEPVEACQVSDQGRAILAEFRADRLSSTLSCPPRLAFTRTVEVPCAFRTEFGSRKNEIDPATDLWRAAAALSLTTAGPVVPACHWYEWDDGDWQAVIGGRGGVYGFFHAPTPAFVRADWPPLDDAAFRTASRLLSQREDGSERIATVSERLNRARTSLDIGVSALDVGIALEATLLDDGRNGELSETLALRAAWLLARQNADERKRIYRIVKKAYSIRSLFAHRGDRKNTDLVIGTETLSTVEVIRAAVELARRALLARVLGGTRVNWEDVVLGDSPPGGPTSLPFSIDPAPQ